MKIAGLVVRVERWEFGAERLNPAFGQLRIRVTSVDGLECNLVQIVKEDDLVSMFDYIWQKTGAAVKEQLEKANENLQRS